MTLAQLRSLLRSYVQESSTVPLSEALATTYINEGAEELSMFAGYSTATFTVTGGLVLNQYDYNINSASGVGTLLNVWTVAVDDTANVLTSIPKTTQQEMEASVPSWREDASGKPNRWWFRGNAVWVYPKPSATYAGTPLEIRGTRIPTDMAADADTPTDLPDAYHKGLAMYAAWQWLMTDRENPTAQRAAGYWKSRYERRAEMLRHLIQGRDDTDGAGLRVQWSRDTGTGLLSIEEDD